MAIADMLKTNTKLISLKYACRHRPISMSHTRICSTGPWLEEGIAIAEALKINTTLTELECDHD
jgi:hypothetical protein